MSSRRPGFAGRYIVVADEDRTIANEVIEALTADGHAVFLAYDGVSALELAYGLKICDLVISNSRTGGKPGLELIRELRALLPAVPVLYLSNPGGIDSTIRRRFLDDLSELNQLKLEETGDPEISTRIAQYEMAYRMQTSVPELTDLSKESEAVFELYGPESRKPGTFAANCLLARRLAERGVRFIQLFHRGWDQHLHLPKQITGQSSDTDQPSAALIADLKQRGLLNDTLIVWGGEFGRTVYCQGKLTAEDYGRDHHPRCFTMWLAGGGVKPGISYGETDDYCYNITKDPVHVHDLHATILHCLGIDHTRLTYKFQGRHFRLTDVHGEVVTKLLA